MRGDQLLSVIIPVYNERSTVLEVIETVCSLDLPVEKEIIVVDDGSDDGTSEQLTAHAGPVRIITNPVNRGKGAAVKIGLEQARGDLILLQDADLETDPNEYLSLLTPILENRSSVVYGSRFKKAGKGVPVIRRIANLFLTSLTNLLYGCRLTDMETAYKVFTKEVADRLELRSDRFEVEPEITAQICKLGYQIVEVPITYNPRTGNEGKKIKFRDGLKAVAMLLACRIRK